FKLDKNQRNHYDALLNQELGSEQLYVKLNSFLYDNFDYVSAFAKVIKRMEKEGHRCLIYGKSKDEADRIAENIPNVSRFPDLNNIHISISWTEGTYGLNNLVFLDTIVTHIPQSDKISQMRGRLDRPGQNSNKLYFELIMVENSIEDAQLFALELANNFYNN